MRKMFSQEQIKKIAQEAGGGLPEIESGDAGKALIVNSGETGVEWGEVGLSPEDQDKLDNSLQLPESAPAAQQLVGINTSGEQNALNIGEGLAVVNGELKSTAGNKVLILDFENSSSKTVTEEQAANITNFVYDAILIQHYGNVNRYIKFVDSQKATNIAVNGNSSFGNYVPSVHRYITDTLVFPSSYAVSVVSTGLQTWCGSIDQGGNYLDLSGTTLTVASSTYKPAVEMSVRFRQEITAASGTLSAANRPDVESGSNSKKGAAGDICYSYKISSSPAQYVYLRCVSYDYTAKKMILQGNWVDWDSGTATLYTMKLDVSTGAYTIA